MLIIEGPDGIGKTRLIKACCVQADLRGIPAIPQNFGLLPKSWDYCEDYMPYVTRDAAMDRFIISELCYGTAIRGKCKIDPTSWAILEGRLAQVGSLTVVLYAKDEASSIAFAERSGEATFTPQQVAGVNDLYIQLANDRFVRSGNRLYKPAVHMSFCLDAFVDDPWEDVDPAAIIEEWVAKRQFRKTREEGR